MELRLLLLLLKLFTIIPLSWAFTSSPSGVRGWGSSPVTSLQHRRVLLLVDAQPSFLFNPGRRPSSTALSLSSLPSGGEGLWLNPHFSSYSSLLLGGGEDSAASSSWRQYASVAVIALVLLDIVLGSPVANSVLNRARAAASEDEDDSADRKEQGGPMGVASRPQLGSSFSSTSKPRIDVDAVAKQALERAEGVTQLREYLDSRKTDWDRMEDLKRKMDDQLAQLDEQQRGRSNSSDAPES